MASPRTRAERRAVARRPAGTTGRGSRWPLVLLPLLFVGVAVFLLNSGAVSTGARPQTGTGEVTPEHAVHEFGTVPLHGGLIAATFPLTIDAPVDAVDLTTS